MRCEQVYGQKWQCANEGSWWLTGHFNMVACNFCKNTILAHSGGDCKVEPLTGKALEMAQAKKALMEQYSRPAKVRHRENGVRREEDADELRRMKDRCYKEEMRYEMMILCHVVEEIKFFLSAEFLADCYSDELEQKRELFNITVDKILNIRGDADDNLRQAGAWRWES